VAIYYVGIFLVIGVVEGENSKSKIDLILIRPNIDSIEREEV